MNLPRPGLLAGAGAILAILLLASSASGRAAGTTDAPDLPDGACGGAWKKPSVVARFGEIVRRPSGDRGPYRGFRLQGMFKRARSYRDSYAEGWVRDTRRAFKASFVFTSQVAKRAKELRSVTAYPSNVRFLRACYTIRELSRIQRVIGRELMWGDDPPFPADVSGIDIDVKRNRVEVYLCDYDESAATRIEDRYQPATRVHRGNVCTWPA